MSVNVEVLEKSMAKLTVEIPVAEIEAAKERVFQKQKNQIAVPGFRKGKATRKMVEKLYGKAAFFEDAINEIVPDAYEKAADESGLEIVSMPQIEYTQVELDKPVVFVATVATRPEVVLGEYKGLVVESEVVEVTEEDLAEELKKAQTQNSVTKEVEGRPVENGDKIKLNFDGFVDGEAFEGGHGEDFPLTIGSGSFIPGFEEQLVGVEVGKEVEVNVTFPAEYHAAELAGKPAVFKCTVNSISVDELPELNDEFASEVSEFETLEEYKQSLRAGLIEKKEAAAKTAKEDALVAKLVENSQMDIAPMMIDTEARQMVDEFEQRLQSQGMNLEMYTQYTGQTVDQMIEQNKEIAKKRIESRLVLEAVVAAEGIVATDEDLDAEIAKMAAQYGMETEEVKKFLNEKDLENLKKNVAVQKALDVVYEAAV